MGNKKAICVGINDFKHVPGARLNGCVNDAKDMAAHLIRQRGFARADVTLLTDARATKAAIMAALGKLVAEAKSGKLSELVFSFSSHGTQVPDDDGDEPLEAAGDLKGKRADEAFCPYDLKQKGDRWDPAYIITDDEFHRVFVQVPQSCMVEVFLDTCHSGTGIKVIELLGFARAPRPRYLPPPSLRAFKALSAPAARPLPRSMLAASTKPAGVRKGTVLWSGCRSDQTSADAWFNERANGAFTRNYIDLALKMPGADRKTLLKAVRAAVKKGGFAQVVQLDENATTR